jgi:hypothetical protein
MGRVEAGTVPDAMARPFRQIFPVEMGFRPRSGLRGALGLSHDPVEHFCCQHARVGIVTRAMIARDERERSGIVPCAVTECVVSSFHAQRCADAVMGDLPERENDFQFWHGLNLRAEKLATCSDLHRQRLVSGRHAAHGVGDRAVDQLDAVVCALSVCAPCKAVGEKRCVEKVTGVVARKGSTGPVGAMQSRRKPDNQQSGRWVAEARNRIIEIFGVGVPVLTPEIL